MGDPTGKKSLERNLALERDRTEGHTYDWIALKYGITRQRAHQIVQMVRVKRRLLEDSNG